MQQVLTQLFTAHYHTPPTAIVPLPRSGSDRQYFRLQSTQHTALGVYNPNVAENEAFVQFSAHFAQKGIQVPQVLGYNKPQNCYLVQDLGEFTLMKLLKTDPAQAITYYKKALEQLVFFQKTGALGLNLSLCTPTAHFDKQGLLWDLNYFKYCFLKPSKADFDEFALQNDFETLANFLCQADQNYLLHRDFQARNLMVHQQKVYLIDYQGCRKGPLQYDVAALLYQAQAQLSPATRHELLAHYLGLWADASPKFEAEFLNYYPAFALIRILQALGAYGFRGIFEQKTEFLQSIAPAFHNLTHLLETENLGVKLPEIQKLIANLKTSAFVAQFTPKTHPNTPQLTLVVNSFSYKKGGIPPDPSQNGGGFVFDCRAILNPGQIAEYKQLTGLDEPVIDYLQKKTTADHFLSNVYKLVEPSIERYLERGFTDLMVNFGCTGGQHRSVYCAQTFAEHVHKKFGTKVALTHIEQNITQTLLHEKK